MTVTTTVTSSAAQGDRCTASDVSGSFEVLRGSAGAGNIVYTLKLTNTSQATCTVSGVPTLAFLDASGAAMAAHSDTGNGHVAVVTLHPGDSARSQVRFSPDVDPCDPGTATTLQVSLPDSSTVDAKIDPATRLCGGGSLQPTPFTGAD